MENIFSNIKFYSIAQEDIRCGNYEFPLSSQQPQFKTVQMLHLNGLPIENSNANKFMLHIFIRWLKTTRRYDYFMFLLRKYNKGFSTDWLGDIMKSRTYEVALFPSMLIDYCFPRYVNDCDYYYLRHIKRNFEEFVRHYCKFTIKEAQVPIVTCRF